VPDIAVADLRRLRDAITAKLGLQFADDELHALKGVAEKRVLASGAGSVLEYVELLERSAPSDEELPALAELLTVGETFFFRGQEQLQALVAQLGRRKPQGDAPLCVLSAGCASGEEPYSLAITLREAFPNLEERDLSIEAFDVNPAVLLKAERALYSAWSLRATSERVKRRYFRQQGRDYALDDRVRSVVRFKLRNLADEWPPLAEGPTYDAIFCRNVLMYFAPQVAKRVVSRFEQALAPGGLLFLGHAETLRGLSQEFHLCHADEAFFYRKRTPDEAPGATCQNLRFAAAPVVAAASEQDWPSGIADSARRIQTLAERSRDFHREQVREDDVNLGRILALVHEERVGEALSLLRALPAAALANKDALLLYALALTNHGSGQDAEATCRRLLQLDELNAGAHYLMALCREQASDRASAVEWNRRAIHLDPSFAMPHLHLGLLAKRSGNTSLAQRELGQALYLLDAEDAARLLLFGGGFSREALMKLCATELAAVGASL
jgi:chemotaxis protein methyltransferase CheR